MDLWVVSLLPLPFGMLALATSSALRGRVREAIWTLPWSPRSRELIALSSLVVAGLAALASTSNQGVWFELPLVLIVIAMWASVLTALPRLSRILSIGWMILVAVVLPFGVRIAGPLHVGNVFNSYDARFGAGDDAAGEAAQEWAAVRRAVAEELADLTQRGTRGVVVVTGNMVLFNSNDLLLHAELDLWQPDVRVVDSELAPPERALQLTPMSDVRSPDGVIKERFIVVVRHDLTTFSPDESWRDLEQQALASGWVEVSSIDLPVEGEVAILRHRDNLR